MIVKDSQVLSTMKQSRAFIYARKSTEDSKSQVASIPDQLQEVGKIYGSENIPVIETFTESKSAKISGVRTQFYKMIARIRKGEANVIKCWKADRLARNGSDGGLIIELVDQGKLEIHTCFGKYDKHNSYMLWIEFMASTKYSKDLSDNIRRGLNQRVANGVYPSHAPLGYRNTPLNLKGNRVIEVDPDRFNLCRQWWELMLPGVLTVEQSLKIITAKGLRERDGGEISRSAAYRFFRNIFYTGLFDYNGERHIGTHEPMVKMEEFLKVQKVLDAKGRKGKGDNPLPFQGLAKCGECGATITGERHPRGNYYRCTKKLGTCSQKYLNSINLEEQLQEYIQKLELNPDFVLWVKKVLKRRNKQLFMNEAKQRELHTKRLEDIALKKELLYMMKIDESLEPAEFQKKLGKLLIEEKQVKEQIQSNPTQNWDKVIDRALDFAQNVSRLFNSGDVFIKQMILKIIGSNIVILDKMLQIEAKTCFILFKDVQEEFYGGKAPLEQENGLPGQAKQELFLTQSHLVLAMGLNSNISQALNINPVQSQELENQLAQLVSYLGSDKFSNYFALRA